MADFETFARDIERIWNEVEDAALDEYRNIIGDTYDAILQMSDPFVRTGAYRSEHVIIRDPGTVALGEVATGGSGGEKIFEHEGRSGPDTPAVEGVDEFSRPNPFAARQVLDRVVDFIPTAIINERFYAFWLEEGTSRMRPKKVFERAANEAASRRIRNITPRSTT